MAKQQLLFEAAKATPPTLANTLARPRLLAALASAPATARWLSAPSGSGKSTVAVQYARSSARALLWYRLDERDDDPAFFHVQLGRACERQLHIAAGRLPQFAETDQRADSDFAARFIGALSRALDGSTPPALVVFDDTHKPRSLRLQRTLAEFARGAGPGIELLFLGEEPPPPALFDAIGTRRLAVCADLDLRFDAAECAGIAQSLRLETVDAATLAALTGGHAGALVIACELLRGVPTPARQAALAAQLHAHLLERLVARLTAAQRDLLLSTCVLPRITRALAASLAQREVDADLDAAADRGLLIRHPADGGVVYEMHGLVRAGLRAIAAQTLGAAGVAALATRACDRLAAEGLLEDAFDTALDFELAATAGALLPALAEHHARHQQPKSLLRAIARAPADEVAGRPMVSLLAGHALLGVDEAQATAAFTRAFDDYERLGDRTGMALAAASQLIGFNLKCAELRAVSTWLARFHRHKEAARAAALPPPWHGILQIAVLAEANMGDSDATTEPERSAALDALLALVTQRDAWLSADQQLAVATLTMLECAVQRSYSLAYRIGELTQALATERALSGLRRGRWWKQLGLLHAWDKDLPHAKRSLDQLRRIVDGEGIDRLRFDLLELQTEIALRDDALDLAEAALPQLTALAAMQIEIADAGLLAARVHLVRGRPQAALAGIEASLAAVRGAGATRSFCRIYELEQVYVLIANDRLTEAALLARSISDAFIDAQSDTLAAIADCVAFLADEAAGDALLARGLAKARRDDFPMLLWRVPAQATRLCLAALERGIEPDFVRQMIRAQKLVPPPTAGPAWPWPVRVVTLGGFDLELDGAPYRPARKAQDRPLDLLKLLALHDSAQAGRLSKPHAALLLWPDAEEGNGLKSLDMAIGRLRKLLGRDDVVQVSDGRLTLAPTQVWIDLRALQLALNALRTTPTPATLAAVVALYRGPLLDGDDEAPWVLGPRRALWDTVRVAVLAACHGPALADHDDACRAALERLQAVDPTAEDVALARMQRHRARSEFAQALAVYAALHRALGVAHGVPPGAATEQLRTQILAAAGTGAAAASRTERLSIDPATRR